MCSSRKLSMRLRGTNFCSSSAYFAPSFVRQPNGSKYTRIVQNAPKHEFRVQWGGSGAIVATNSDVTLCYEHLHLFSLFCTEFHKPTKLSQMHPIVQNAPKHDFWMQWGGSGAFVAKNFDATSWKRTFCTSSAHFALSFIRRLNGSECTQIV